jgi:hypothetical protein
MLFIASTYRRKRRRSVRLPMILTHNELRSIGEKNNFFLLLEKKDASMKTEREERNTNRERTEYYQNNARRQRQLTVENNFFFVLSSPTITHIAARLHMCWEKTYELKHA